MNIDLKPMLRGEITRLPIDFPIEPEAPYGVSFDGDVRVVGEITNQGGYMRLIATAEIPYSGVCARCLGEVSGVYTMPFERTVVTEGTLTEEQEEDNVDEYVILQNGMLDIDDSVRESLILTFPMRLLCDEDCPGLCSKALAAVPPRRSIPVGRCWQASSSTRSPRTARASNATPQF